MSKTVLSKVIVVSVGFNVPENIINRNILSVQKQSLNKKLVHIVVDDGSYCCITSVVSRYNDVKYFRNETRIGAGNLFHIKDFIGSPDDIIVMLNLNNWFADPYSLQTIVSYNDFGTWVTYGSYISSNSCKKRAEWIEKIPESTLKSKLHRVSKWRPSLPLSFRAHLLDNINMDYFKKQDGTWIQSSYDIPLFHMLLDMTPYNKVKLLEEIIAVNNVEYVDPEYEIEYNWCIEHINSLLPLDEIDDGQPVIDCKFILLPIQITSADIKKYGGK